MTFFFNGGCEAAFDLEDRQLVPSPKVATYDLQPEMSVGGVAEAVSDTPHPINTDRPAIPWVEIPSLLAQPNTPLPPASDGGGNEEWQVPIRDVQPGPS